MNIDLKKYLSENILLLDGATGTEMQKRGMPQGVCPEYWAVQNPEILERIQREYIKVGSKVVYTFTFGANKIKLSEYGLEDKIIEINKKLAEISRRAVGKEGFVAGDLAPAGRYIEPVGELTFEQAVDNYKAQVKGLLAGGVDFFVIETMMDIQEARAALLAVKESCDLPAFVSMTFQENNRTLTGTDPVTALIILQNLGADVVGCNCSTGPAEMVNIIKSMKPYAKIPLMAKPNAGLPQFKDGKTVFDMDEESFAKYIPDLIKAGANVIGGCCGTTPKYIKRVKEIIANLKPLSVRPKKVSILTSSREYVELGFDKPVSIVGERINPTGKKKLQEELRNGNFDIVRKLALEQVDKGATILDVNVGTSGIDEKEIMVKAINLLSQLVHIPLCIDSSDPDVIEAALRIYPGRALVNSISLEEVKIKKLLPIAAKYGAMFILLPLSDAGLPKNIKEKHSIIQKVYAEAQKYNYDKEDIIVDGLVMTVSANQEAAKNTLKTIEWCTNEFGTGTIIGLSNVSFGLPQRGFINSAFLAMAISKGLTMAIANPSNELLMNVKMASDVLVEKDKNSQIYVDKLGNKDEIIKKDDKNNSNKNKSNLDEDIFNAVLKGNRKNIVELLKRAIEEGKNAKDIVEGILIPAITKVGELFEKEIYFLPQLIMSAEAMKKGFEYLEPILEENGEGIKDKRPKIILATVKGDIHDIGKNIVGLMLKNHGFEVIDLGKDVEPELIIKTAKETKAQLIGLSALMTTTMINMKDVVEIVKKENLNVKIMIGGAVITEQFANEIGADGYSKDANEAVKLAKSLIIK